MEKFMDVAEYLHPSRAEISKNKHCTTPQMPPALEITKTLPTLTRLFSISHHAGVVWHLSTQISVFARHISVQLHYEVGWRQPRGAVDVLRQTEHLEASQFMVISTPLANSSGHHGKIYCESTADWVHKTSGFAVCLFVC